MKTKAYLCFCLLLSLTITIVALGTKRQPIIVAFGDKAMSFPYTWYNYNQTDVGDTYKDLDKNYTSWKVEITNYLTYNATTSGHATTRLCANASGDNPYLDFHEHADGNTYVWYASDGESYKLAEVPWKAEKPLIISLNSNGYLNIGNSTDSDAFVDDYALGNFTLCRIGAYGTSSSGGAINWTENEMVATTGYVSVDTVVYSTSMTDALTMIVPSIVSLTMLGVAMGIMKKWAK